MPRVPTNLTQSVISDFRCDVDVCALLVYYAASSANNLPTFRDNVSVPCSWAKKSKEKEDGPICCPETSVKYYHSRLRNIPEQRRQNLTQCRVLAQLFSQISGINTPLNVWRVHTICSAYNEQVAWQGLVLPVSVIWQGDRFREKQEENRVTLWIIPTLACTK